jgi:hypothetical protein
VSQDVQNREGHVNIINTLRLPCFQDVNPKNFGSVFCSEQSIDSIMEELIIQTGTPPGPEGIALWVTMKNHQRDV